MTKNIDFVKPLFRVPLENHYEKKSNNKIAKKQ